LRNKKLEAKIGEESALFPSFFILSLLAFSLSPRRAFTTIITTSYTLDFPTPLGTPPPALLIRPSKPYSSFSS